MRKSSLQAILGAVLVAIAPAAFAACEWPARYQKIFASDAIHYTSGDLDGDGTAEIISTSETTVSYRGAPTFAPVVLYTTTAVGAPVAADVTGDGKIDVIIPNSGAATLVVLKGNGDRTFSAPVVTNLSVTPTRVSIGNFTGDAKADVAVIGSSFARVPAGRR